MLENPLDRFIAGFDRALRTVAGVPQGRRASPAEDLTHAALTQPERAHAAALMRVNHAGEVCVRSRCSVGPDPEQEHGRYRRAYGPERCLPRRRNRYERRHRALVLSRIRSSTGSCCNIKAALRGGFSSPHQGRFGKMPR